MSDITEEDVMKYCYSRNLMLVTKESLEYMHRPIVIENAPTVKAIPIEWILKWACEFIDPNSEGYKMAMELVHDWRKENEENI